jgi:hypothetical protein
MIITTEEVQKLLDEILHERVKAEPKIVLWCHSIKCMEEFNKAIRNRVKELGIKITD